MRKDSMRAAVFRGPNNIEVQEVPFADNPATFLKVNACAVCGYDVRVFKNGHRKVSPPVILGHELCGEIQKDTKVEDGVIKAGSRVALCPLVPCLQCPYCQSGRYNLCTNLMEIGSTHDGGFAQYVTIPEQISRIGGLVPVPDNLSDEEAALLEPLACCLNSFSRLTPIAKSSPVVIVGDGPIGLLHVQLFKRLAGARVGVIGKVSSRMEKAKSMGADAVFEYHDSDTAKTVTDVMDFAGASGASIAVVSTSNPQAFEFAAKVVGKDSKINIFAGMPSGQLFPLDANWVHYNQISITGTFSSTPALLHEAAGIAAEKIVDLSKVITHHYSLIEIGKAIIATEKYYGLRVIVNKF